MSQVITSPTLGSNEAAAKNWYRAEALRKVKNDLLNIFNDVEDEPARRELKVATDSIEEARCLLDPRLRPAPKRVRPK